MCLNKETNKQSYREKKNENVSRPRKGERGMTKEGQCGETPVVTFWDLWSAGRDCSFDLG